MSKNYSRWMEDNWEHLYQRKLSELVIPGTHDSGSFSALNTLIARTQDRTIKSQLEGGIRFFDLRVSKKPDGSYHFHHGGGIPANNSQSFLTGLGEIAEFTKAHPFEMLILKVRPGHGSSLNDGDKLMVLEYIVKALTPDPHTKYYETPPYLIPAKRVNETIFQLQRHNYRILLVTQDMNTEKFADRSLDYDSSFHFINDDKQFSSEVLLTIGRRADIAFEHADKELRKSRPKLFNHSSQVLSSINIKDNAYNNVLPRLCRSMYAWDDNPETHPNMNIFDADFFDLYNNRFLDTIVDINVRRTKRGQ